jgi:hypothetical protein
MRLVDADKIIFREIDEIGGEYEPYLGCSKSQINSLPTVEAIPKADYENRLKADLKAILVELQLEIEEKSIIDYDEDLYDGGECVISISEINEIIQQKINSLKEA